MYVVKKQQKYLNAKIVVVSFVLTVEISTMTKIIVYIAKVM